MSHWGRKGEITFDLIKEKHPLQEKDQAWERREEQDPLVMLHNVDAPGANRHGLPQCQVFQREAFKRKVTTHAPEITAASDVQKFHNELLTSILMWLWPSDNPDITSKSFLLSLSLSVSPSKAVLASSVSRASSCLFRCAPHATTLNPLCACVESHAVLGSIRARSSYLFR